MRRSRFDTARAPGRRRQRSGSVPLRVRDRRWRHGLRRHLLGGRAGHARPRRVARDPWRRPLLPDSRPGCGHPPGPRRLLHGSLLGEAEQGKTSQHEYRIQWTAHRTSFAGNSGYRAMLLIVRHRHSTAARDCQPRWPPRPSHARFSCRPLRHTHRWGYRAWRREPGGRSRPTGSVTPAASRR